MKKINFLYAGLVVIFLFPQAAAANLTQAYQNDLGLMINSITLWLAVAVGIIATASIFWDAKQFKGGVLEKFYHYFGFGMFLILAGLVVLIVKPWDVDLALLRLHDIFYIIGFLIIIIGAKKIIKAYKNN